LFDQENRYGDEKIRRIQAGKQVRKHKNCGKEEHISQLSQDGEQPEYQQQSRHGQPASR
jgi:hypothetical protein